MFGSKLHFNVFGVFFFLALLFLESLNRPSIFLRFKVLSYNSRFMVLLLGFYPPKATDFLRKISQKRSFILLNIGSIPLCNCSQAKRKLLLIINPMEMNMTLNQSLEMIDNLWSESISLDEKIITPVTILKQQARYLGEMTQNAVGAEVSLIEDLHRISYGLGPNKFVYAFMVVAPALNNYQYKLFTIIHDIVPYPLELFFFDEKYTLTDEEEFFEILRYALSDDRTIKVVRSLVSQSV